MTMKKTLSQKLFIAIFLALISILCVGDSYAFRVGARPFHIDLIGTIVPLEEKRDSRTFDLMAGENTWRFRVTRADNRGSSSVTGWRILQDVFPRILNLVGDQKIIQPLMQPEVVGKDFKLNGRLYLQSNKYFLSSVSEVLEEEELPETE
jgi:hypothetical protein